MDDLTPLRDMRADTPAPTPESLNSARAELLRATGGRRRTRRFQPSSFGRLRFRLATAAALAVTLGAGLALVADGGDGGPTTATGDTDAQLVLRRAAQTAGDQPMLPARPDQFVFVESIVAHTSTRIDTNGNVLRTDPVVPELRRIWLSVDGNHDGVLRTGPRSGSGPWETISLSTCNGPPNDHGEPTCLGYTSPYRADLPTDAEAMRGYLHENSHGGNPSDVQAFITVGDTIRESYVPPRALAAMFEAAAGIPGVTVTEDAVDAAGRHGIAVGMSDGGVREELIFAPDTYAFLGERVTDEEGKVTGASARLRLAVVDQAGQLPD